MNEILALAAQLYTHAVEMAERPITGYVEEYAALNERWVNNTREHLHLFLKLNADKLDEEWTGVLHGTETEEIWDAFLS